MTNPNYANIANTSLTNRFRHVRRGAGRNIVIPLDYRQELDIGALGALWTAGFRLDIYQIDTSDLSNTNVLSVNSHRVRLTRPNDGETHINIVVAAIYESMLRSRWFNRIRMFYRGVEVDLRLDYPVLFDIDDGGDTTLVESGLIFSNQISDVQVTPISATMFELMLSYLTTKPDAPIFVDIPDVVVGQGDGARSYRLPDNVDIYRLSGAVDNRVLGAWRFAYVTPDSLPVQTLHAHFEPFVSPSEVTELAQIGIQVYIDEFGLVHFPNLDVYRSYLRAHVAGIKFNREWLHSRDLAKSGYADVAASLPDRMLAAKSTMVTNFDAAVNSDQYDRAVNRFKDNTLLSELFSSRLDGITEIAQAKVDKLVRSVQKKRDLGDRLNGIIGYYRNNPNSSISLPAGIPDAQLRGLISQPLSKLLKDIETNQTDAEIAEMLSADLHTRLGFQRRVTA